MECAKIDSCIINYAQKYIRVLPLLKITVSFTNNILLVIWSATRFYVGIIFVSFINFGINYHFNYGLDVRRRVTFVFIEVHTSY
jgi:hypothetical protein